MYPARVRGAKLIDGSYETEWKSCHEMNFRFLELSVFQLNESLRGWFRVSFTLNRGIKLFFSFWMLKEKSSAKEIQIIFDLNFAIHEKQKRIDGGGMNTNAARES